MNLGIRGLLMQMPDLLVYVLQLHLHLMVRVRGQHSTLGPTLHVRGHVTRMTHGRSVGLHPGMHPWSHHVRMHGSTGSHGIAVGHPLAVRTSSWRTTGSHRHSRWVGLTWRHPVRRRHHSSRMHGIRPGRTGRSLHGTAVGMARGHRHPLAVRAAHVTLVGTHGWLAGRS